MAKKRTSLDSLFSAKTAETANSSIKPKIKPEPDSATPAESNGKNQPKQLNEASPKIAIKAKSEIIKQTVYLPAAVHEQLRQLAFEERKKMHDYLVEGLDRVFKERGLKPYNELSSEKKLTNQ